MNSWIALVGVFVLSALLIVASVLAIKTWGKRDNRRSPLHGKKLAHLPGQQLMARIDSHGEEMLLAAMIMYFAAPLMLCGWALSWVRWDATTFGINEALFVVMAAFLFAAALWSFVKHWDARNKARDGLVAEQMTGQLLNRLIGPNCIVAHDLPCGGFNIDHIVIAPRAVYAVETKSFRKPRGSTNDSHYKVTFDGEALRFPDWVDRAPIKQARGQAQWLARYLRESLGRDIPVIPAVALPGWWVERTDGGKQSDVRVFTPMGKGAEYLLLGQELIDAPSRALVAQAIALRYPEVGD